MEDEADCGKAYTTGSSFRARAEARQRVYRARDLKGGWSKYGHFLDAAAVQAGRNFVTTEACQAARDRADAGKGVAQRTFENMLSSQAMSFNVFVPLARDLALATRLLSPFVPGLKQVRSITFEYTPPPDLFRDQRGLGGVDCDILVEAEWQDGALAVMAVETKFVEPEFSRCGFRRPGRQAKGKPICPEDVRVQRDTGGCLYESQKGYLYWKRTIEHDTIAQEALSPSGCPFGGPLWQLWVNHALAHVEASRRGGKHARYAVCAPANNNELLRGGTVIEEFRKLTTDPNTVLFIGLDDLIRGILEAAAGVQSLEGWAQGIKGRYYGI